MGRKSHAIVSATFWGLKFRVKFCNLYKMFVASQRLYSCWPRVRAANYAAGDVLVLRRVLLQAGETLSISITRRSRFIVLLPDWSHFHTTFEVSSPRFNCSRLSLSSSNLRVRRVRSVR